MPPPESCPLAGDDPGDVGTVTVVVVRLRLPVDEVREVYDAVAEIVVPAATPESTIATPTPAPSNPSLSATQVAPTAVRIVCWSAPRTLPVDADGADVRMRRQALEAAVGDLRDLR